MSEQVTVCIDFKSPHALLAVAPTRALEARLATHFDWRPLVLPQLPRPQSIDETSDRGTRHRSLRAAYAERDLVRYASAQGIALRDPYRDPDTSLASLGLLWLRRTSPQRAGEYVARVFELLWQRDADVASPAMIEAALGGESSAFRDFAEKEGPRAVAENQKELFDAGVRLFPTYLLRGELFIGRQHLPMIEWLLRGQTGPVPI